jgi:hypothetical protein
MGLHVEIPAYLPAVFIRVAARGFQGKNQAYQVDIFFNDLNQGTN